MRKILLILTNIAFSRFILNSYENRPTLDEDLMKLLKLICSHITQQSQMVKSTPQCYSSFDQPNHHQQTQLYHTSITKNNYQEEPLGIVESTSQHYSSSSGQSTYSKQTQMNPTFIMHNNYQGGSQDMIEPTSQHHQSFASQTYPQQTQMYPSLMMQDNKTGPSHHHNLLHSNDAGQPTISSPTPNNYVQY